MVSDLSYKIIGFRNDPTFTMDDAVDWAIEMMRLGYGGENLYILAGLTKPVNYFEGEEYLAKTLQEIGLKESIGVNATLGYSIYYIKQLAMARNVSNNLKAICQYRFYAELEELLIDFYLLYWEWDEINQGTAYREYWPEATSENIERTIVQTAQTWLATNYLLFEPLVKMGQ